MKGQKQGQHEFIARQAGVHEVWDRVMVPKILEPEAVGV